MKHKSNLWVLLYCVALAFTCLSVYGYTTSPFYHEPGAGDSAIFQLIGKEWVDGKLPYVALWDLKGPLIFFMNYLGYLLTGSRLGVFIVEMVSLTITLYLLWKLLRTGFSAKYSSLLLLFPTFSFAANNVGGNCVEEYLLPLLALSFYLLYQWLSDPAQQQAANHPPKYAFVYGLVLAFSLLTRLTNALGICAAVAVIAFWLMIKGRFRNLFSNLLYFILGFAVLFIPFASYFAFHHAFDEMWYGTFLYNLDYAAASSSELHSLPAILKALIHFADTWLLLFVSVLVLIANPRRRLAGLIWLFVSLFSIVWLLRGNGYPHYGLISLPCICIAFLEVKLMVENASSRAFRGFVISLSALYGLVTMVYCARSYLVFMSLYDENTELARYRTLLGDLPADYRRSFIAYNCNPDLYLYENIVPCYRFFVFQDFECHGSNSLKAKMREEFSGNAKWILVKGHAREIAPILETRYTVFKNDASCDLRLYKLK